MKTKLFILMGLALSISAVAQTNTTTKQYAKATALPAISQASSGAQNPKEFFAMTDNQVRAVKGGIPTFMASDRWLKNDAVITPEGLVLTYTGKKIYLQNGETIDGEGVITSKRCAEIAPEAAMGGTCMVQ